MHDETPSWYFFQSMVVEARDLQPQRPREINGWRPSARKDSAKGWASFGGFEVKGFIGNHLRRILQTRQKMLCIWLNSPSSTYYLCYTYTSISTLIRGFENVLRHQCTMSMVYSFGKSIETWKDIPKMHTYYIFPHYIVKNSIFIKIF